MAVDEAELNLNIGAAVKQLIEEHGHGRYCIIVDATCDAEGMVFNHEWWWRPPPVPDGMCWKLVPEEKGPE